MATLYVENVPDDLYEALRNRAKAQHRSIAAEVLSLLEQNIPTAQELKKRQELVQRILRMRETEKSSGRVYPSAEEMVREDRER